MDDNKIDPFHVEKIQQIKETEESKDLDALFLEADKETDGARLRRLEAKINKTWKALSYDEQMAYLVKVGHTALVESLQKTGGKIVEWNLKTAKEAQCPLN